MKRSNRLFFCSTQLALVFALSQGAGCAMETGEAPASAEAALSSDIEVPVTWCPNGQCFADVPPNSTFATYINELAVLGCVGGYTCGGAGEPCDSDCRPYFRPNNPLTRGQV